MQAVLCPPSKSGHPQAVEPASHLPAHKDLLLTKLLQFSLSSQLQQGGRNSPAPAKSSPQPTPPGYPAYRCRSSAAAAGSAQAGRRLQPLAQRRGLPEPLQLLPQAGRRDRKKEGAESPAQSQAPGLQGSHLQPPLAWGGCLGGRVSRICSIAESPCCALFEASLCLGKLIPRVRDSQLPLQVPPLTPPSITVQILPGALNAPSTAASLGLCSCLLSSSI